MMTTPVNKKFVDEFQEKQAKKSCFGFLRSRKVKKIENDEVVFLAPVMKSPAIRNINEMNKLQE